MIKLKNSMIKGERFVAHLKHAQTIRFHQQFFNKVCIDFEAHIKMVLVL